MITPSFNLDKQIEVLMLEFQKDHLVFKWEGKEQRLRFPTALEAEDFAKKADEFQKEPMSKAIGPFLVDLGLDKKLLEPGGLSVRQIRKIIEELNDVKK